MRATRIDRVIAVSRDAEAAAATFARAFGLKPAPAATSGPPEATAGALTPGRGAEGGGPASSPDDVRVLTIGSAEIAFVRPAPDTELAGALAMTGEGMAALHLEVADLDAATRALEHAGITYGVATRGGRRVIHVEPIAAHGVRLSLVGPA